MGTVGWLSDNFTQASGRDEVGVHNVRKFVCVAVKQIEHPERSVYALEKRKEADRLPTQKSP